MYTYIYVDTESINVYTHTCLHSVLNVVSVYAKAQSSKVTFSETNKRTNAQAKTEERLVDLRQENSSSASLVSKGVGDVCVEPSLMDRARFNALVCPLILHSKFS